MGEKIVVVGGGIIGLAAAYRTAERFPEARVTVLEKGTGRRPTSERPQQWRSARRSLLQARLAKSAAGGARHPPDDRVLRIAFHRPRNLRKNRRSPPARTKLPRLQNFIRARQQNGLEDLQMLNGDQLREIEPHAAGIAAVRVPKKASPITPPSVPLSPMKFARGWRSDPQRERHRDRARAIPGASTAPRETTMSLRGS